MRVAGLIETEYRRDDALAAVALALAEVGHIGEALSIAASVSNNFGLRTQAKLRVAEALVAAGRTDEAGRVVGAAELAAGSIKGKYWQARVLTGVARVHAMAGNTHESRQVIREAERIANFIEEPSMQAQALAAVSEAQTAIGETNQAQRVLGLAQRLAEASEDEGGQRAFSLDLARRVHPDRAAEEVAAAAIEASGTDLYSNNRSGALAAIVRALASFRQNRRG